MKKSIFSVFVISLFVAALTPVAAAEKDFVTLNGEQIKRVFSDAYDVQLPEDGAGWSGADWLLTFQPDGTWEATTYEAWGNWRVEGNSLCVALVGGNTQWNAPYEGCLGVKVNVENGVIAASIPKMKLRHFVMKEGAYGELASLKPAPQTSEKAVSSKKLPVGQPAAPPKDDARERALEEQRLALERQRLELEKQKLEMQRQALLLKQQQRQQQEQRAAHVDDIKPVIQTVEAATTKGKTVRIAGVARDDVKLARVEVAGRRVDVDGGTGRFSAVVPIALGRNRVAVTAMDASGNKAERIVLVTRKRDIPEIEFGTYHAVVIGINDYDSLPKLQTAIADARAVAATLENEYGYTIHLMENPTRADIIDKLDELRETLVEADNLLIYYAGHGWLDEQSGRGYWMPVNARNDRRSRWVSNATLTDALQALHAKHVMVVADSCYSGTLTRSVKVPERNKAYIERIAEKRARVVLSSGGLEPVADSGGGKHSVFAAQFLKALRTNEGVLDGTQMFERVRQTVVLNADQTPEYSDIRKAGHEGGDFLFVRKDE